MLGLAGRITESLKALNKQLVAVVWQAVAHKPIWVFLAAAVISAPCLAETPAVNGAKKVSPELVSGGKVLGKGLDQSTVKRMAAKPGENGRVDSGAEGGSSGGKANAMFAPEREAMIAKDAEQANGGSYQCDGYCGLYLSLPMFLLPWLLPMFDRKTPNVNSTSKVKYKPEPYAV